MGGGEMRYIKEAFDTNWVAPLGVNVDGFDLLRKGRRIKAMIPVHLYGMPAKMEEIMAIASRYDIPVIEDAAESLGSTYQETLKSFADFATIPAPFPYSTPTSESNPFLHLMLVP